MNRFQKFVLSICVPALFAGSAFAACDTGSLGASQYILCMPDNWNGSMVVYAHGYVDTTQPIGVPFSQLFVGGVFLPDAFNNLGFGFAASSYSKNGLAIVQGVDDTRQLVLFLKQMQHPPLKIYLIGASEGGLVATLSAERYPELYNAAGGACGPIGSFRDQINYFGDFRVVFDYFFPGVIPGSPVDIPPDVIANWDSTYAPNIVAALAAHPLATAQLLSVMRTPTDGTPAGIAEAVVGILWYNVFATNDANATLQGQPFDNHRKIYTGSRNDFLLNLRVQRFRASRTALDHIAADYETTGALLMPEVTLHTTGDPIVPYWHEPLYTIKTFLKGTLLERTNLPVLRYGHCNFTGGDVLAAFGLMVLKDTGLNLTSQIQSTLSGPDLSSFRAAAQTSGLGRE